MIRKIITLCGIVAIVFTIGCGPRTPEAELERIVELLEQNRTLDALIRLENFIDYHPDEPLVLDAYILLTRLYIQNENYADALDIIGDIQQSPHYIEELSVFINQLKMRAYMGDQQYEQALELLNEDIQKVQNDLKSEDESIREVAEQHYGGIMLVKAQIYLRMQEYDAAVEILEKVKEEAGSVFDQADAARILINHYLAQDKPEEAEHEVRLISEELLPEVSAAQWLRLKLAKYYETHEEKEKARQHYEYIRQWTDKALMEAQEEDDREEIVAYKTALADLEYQMGNFDEAEALYVELEEEYSNTKFVQAGQIQNRILGLQQHREYLQLEHEE